MRPIAGVALGIAGLMIASSAAAAPVCEAIKAAVDVGLKDKTFAPLRASAKMPGNFGCSVTVEGGQGFFACQRLDFPSGAAAANAIISDLTKCLGVKPEVHVDEAGSVKAIFVIRADPLVEVAIDGAGEGGSVYLNVIAR